MREFKSQAPVSGVQAPNTIARVNETFHLSYNSSTSGYGCVTTALVIDHRVFFILCGDHRVTWVADTLDVALAYFMEHCQQAHEMSEHNMALGFKYDTWGCRGVLVEHASPERIEMMKTVFAALIQAREGDHEKEAE